MTVIEESLKAFIVARPPIVAFFLSLLAITLTLFLVAFYIKDNDLILDRPAQEDWRSIIKFLTSQELCINMTGSDQSPKILTETEPTKSFSGMCFPVHLYNLHANHSPLYGLAHATRLEGLISLKGWTKYCPNHEHIPEVNGSVAITLIVPPNLQQLKNDTSWIYFGGLPHILPDNASRCQNVNVPSQITGELSSYSLFKLQSTSKTNNSVCRPEEMVQLSPISSPVPEVYLSINDKLQVYSHLLQIDFVFLGILIMVLVAGVVRGRTMVLTRRHTLLPTKETS